MPIPLSQTSLSALRGVGPAMLERLAKLSINTVQDLLFHLPRTYQDRTRVTPLRDARDGDSVMVEGTIVESQEKIGKRRQLIVSLRDASGFPFELRFFYFNVQQKKAFKAGLRVRAFGEIRRFKGAKLIMHPEYRVLDPNEPLVLPETLHPVYPSTEGLGQAKWLQLTEQALQLLDHEGQLPDYVPSLANKGSLKAALKYVHRPPPDAHVELLTQGLHPSQQRLAFEELLAHHLSLLQVRAQYQEEPAPAFVLSEKTFAAFSKQLGFDLTAAQRRVWNEIAEDLAKPQAMLRLVQGDVGCGKTAIAALAALVVASHDHQVALMAPTSLLAEQHYVQFQKWFEPLNIRVELLTGSLKSKAYRNSLENIHLGLSQIVIGTQALFQEAVQFKQLSLVMMDEQHRFGVEQRLALRQKGQGTGQHPHQLMLTATPIPRSLAMASYADLDISVIDELPPGRVPITTLVMNQEKRIDVMVRVQALCEGGGQVYWVCPLIEESEVLDAESAEKIFTYLRAQMPTIKMGLVHGRLSSSDKDIVMGEFKRGEIQLLVATTVIEVGVNVPNATLMVIENAERLGLAQLHQLRGRVGRGAAQSYTLLLYQAPLSPIAEQRLSLMRSTQDGFVIAQKDLELRGAGELLGTRQTGLQQYRIADFWRDKDLLPEVKKVADEWLKSSASETVQPIEALIARWVADPSRYVKV